MRNDSPENVKLVNQLILNTRPTVGKKNSDHKYIREIQVKFRKKRVSSDSPVDRPILDPEDLVEVFQEMQDETSEKLIGVSLDASNVILAFEVISIGTINVVGAKMMEILRTPIIVKASSFVLIHNHPSGDAEPSEEDRKLTEEILDLGSRLGLPLVDHIIIGDGDYFSFAENGLIEVD